MSAKERDNCTTMFAVIVLFCIVPELFDKDVCNGMCVFFEIQVK